MPERNIGKEIIAGLEEIKSWKRGASHAVPRARLRIKRPARSLPDRACRNFAAILPVETVLLFTPKDQPPQAGRT